MSAPPVLMPDAVAVVTGYLRARLAARGDTAPVGSRVPSPRPARFVRIERIGGPASSPVTDRPRLDVHCWGADEVSAHDLMQLCRALLGAARGAYSGTTLARPAVGGPQWLPDPASGQARFAFTFDITLRGTAL
ncbi:hypothetical protein [Streptomyces sp. A1136]|uniref:hypothetical protein n=1 Tax=Streptomyces sp. A1136 TaxID=2563102 RepID=UPI001F0EB643|nr:hypothetical protein [Streptomyces sp. A1136]